VRGKKGEKKCDWSDKNHNKEGRGGDWIKKKEWGRVGRGGTPGVFQKGEIVLGLGGGVHQ